MVLTRAFACATPVVASDIPGYRDVITPETAIGVPPEDPAALADAVSSLLEDEPLRRALGEAARREAIEQYAWRTSPAGSRASTSGSRPTGRTGGGVNANSIRAPRNPWWRALLLVPPLALAGLLLWWRGPDWGLVYHAFDFVAWRWIVAAFALNLGRSSSARSPGGRRSTRRSTSHIHASTTCSPRSGSGSSPTPCCPAGSASSRAWPCCAATCRTATGRAPRSSAPSSRTASSTSCPCCC